MQISYNEPTAALRRIPVVLQDALGNPVTGVVPAGAELLVSLSGAALGAPLGSWVEEGSGAYYYQATQAETITDSFVMIRVAVSTARTFVFSVDIGIRTIVNESDASARRYPIYLVNAVGTPQPGLTITGSACQLGKNGGAFVDGAGAVAEILYLGSGLGAYYYEAALAEVNTLGYDLMKVDKTPTALLYLYEWNVVPLPVTPPLTPPVISNLSPVRAVPGGPGAFSLSYSVGRTTPIEFDITEIVPGAKITITVKLANRDETYVALAQDGLWRWPFDVFSSIGDLSLEPVHVSLMPRDGWPPVVVEVLVSAVQIAIEA